MTTTNLADRESATCESPPATGDQRDAAARRSKIIAAAEGRLRASPYLSLRTIYCEFHEGMLILRGSLPTYYMKQQAQAAVADVEGVGRVFNQIEVCSLDVLRCDD